MAAFARRNANGEMILPIVNGSLICGPGDDYELGGYIIIKDDEGEEYANWESTEWGDDPECVMGAIFGAIMALQEGKPKP